MDVKSQNSEPLGSKRRKKNSIELPNELLIEIFCFLSTGFLIHTVSFGNKRFHDLVESEYLYRKHHYPNLLKFGLSEKSDKYPTYKEHVKKEMKNRICFTTLPTKSDTKITKKRYLGRILRPDRLHLETQTDRTENSTYFGTNRLVSAREEHEWVVRVHRPEKGFNFRTLNSIYLFSCKRELLDSRRFNGVSSDYLYLESIKVYVGFSVRDQPYLTFQINYEYVGIPIFGNIGDDKIVKVKFVLRNGIVTIECGDIVKNIGLQDGTVDGQRELLNEGDDLATDSLYYLAIRTDKDCEEHNMTVFELESFRKI